MASLVLLYRPGASRQADRAGELLRNHFDVRETGKWIEFEAMAPGAVCGIVYVENLHDLEFERLVVYRARHPSSRLVLITGMSPQNAEMAKSIRIDDVVWASEMEDRLVPAVRREWSAHLLESLCEAFRAHDALPNELRVAIVHVLKTPWPLLDQGELSKVVGCDRSTLVRQWNRSVAGPQPPTFKMFLDWVTLLRALIGKRPALTWTSVAEDVGVPLRTLSRVSNRLTGKPIGVLESGDLSEIAHRFLDEVVTPILGPVEMPPDLLDPAISGAAGGLPAPERDREPFPQAG